jgi:hypothetical protein
MASRHLFDHGDERKTTLPDSAVIVDTKAQEGTGNKAQQLALVCPLGAEGKLDESQMQWIPVSTVGGASRGIGFSPSTYGMTPGMIVDLNYDNQQNPIIVGVRSNYETNEQKADTNKAGAGKQRTWHNPSGQTQTASVEGPHTPTMID